MYKSTTSRLQKKKGKYLQVKISRTFLEKERKTGKLIDVEEGQPRRANKLSGTVLLGLDRCLRVISLTMSVGR